MTGAVVLIAVSAWVAQATDRPLRERSLWPTRSPHAHLLAAEPSAPGAAPVDATGVGWKVGGVIGAACAGTTFSFLGLAVGRPGEGRATVSLSGLAAGGVIGGVGGYFLGREAQSGTRWAQVAVVVLDILALPSAGIGAVGALVSTVNGGTG